MAIVEANENLNIPNFLPKFNFGFASTWEIESTD